jgi:hypothetical protein
MLKVLALEFGLGVTLFLIGWSIKKVIAQFRPRSSERSQANDRDPDETCADWVNGMTFPGDYDYSLTGCDPEVNSVCAETVEVMSEVGEGIRSLAEGASESLGSLTESLGNMIAGS